MLHNKHCLRVGPSRHGLGVYALGCLHVHDRVGPIQGGIVEDPDYESDYCMELGKDLALEPDSPFCYLNHSCVPNCALVEIEVENEDGNLVPQLWLEIEADIALGEQMTIDYGWPASAAIHCSCGHPACRGWIVAAGQTGKLDRSTGGNEAGGSGVY